MSDRRADGMYQQRDTRRVKPIPTTEVDLQRGNGKRRAINRLRGSIPRHPFGEAFLRNKFERHMISQLKRKDRQLNATTQQPVPLDEASRVRADEVE